MLTVLILSFAVWSQVQQLKLRGQVDTQKQELALAATALRAAEARQRETSQLLFDANKKTKELEEALKATTKALDETKRLSEEQSGVIHQLKEKISHDAKAAKQALDEQVSFSSRVDCSV